MRLSQPDPTGRRFRWPHAAALVAGGAIVGGIAAASLTAGAATTTPSSPGSSSSGSSSSSTNNGSAPAGTPGNGRSSSPVRSDEQAVSAATAATLKAAALKAVPGGTVYRIETDAGDGAYEAHMTKADGTLVTVKFDKNLKVTKVEDGMGTGDPAPAGGQGPSGQGSSGG